MDGKHAISTSEGMTLRQHMRYLLNSAYLRLTERTGLGLMLRLGAGLMLRLAAGLTLRLTGLRLTDLRLGDLLMLLSLRLSS